MATKKIVARRAVKKRTGYLYFINAAGDVVESPMKRGGTRGHRTCKAAAKKSKPAAKKKPVKTKGFFEAIKPKKKAVARKKPVARAKTTKKKTATKRTVKRKTAAKRK